jgi:hypothetical protein
MAFNRKNKLFTFNALQVSYYSSESNKKSIQFIDNEFVCYLPSINTDNPDIDTSYIAKDETFSDYLEGVLQAIAKPASPKKYDYEFKFNLYQHSNKRSDLDPYHFIGEFPEYISIVNKGMSIGDGMRLIFSNKSLYGNYQYHGYGQTYYIRFNFKNYPDNNYNKLIKLCVDSLLRRVKVINEDSSSDEFIEINKWVYLEMRRIRVKGKSNSMNNTKKKQS